MDSFTSTLWTGPFQVEGMSGYFSFIPYLIEIPVLDANSVDADQMPRYAVSDQDIHCFPRSLLWDARLIWAYQIRQQNHSSS